ncbi:uncharacterized protein LOC108088940 [Drosophila ficusphila]|uniref:uncharacterized protein LOC108088940 n=1 Tax=Drosophila ficusphila TaxID=30025 RepID=UPI0007E771A0|nr:uncharacterized protein LOC108088940 [Drosophila ficusphila]
MNELTISWGILYTRYSSFTLVGSSSSVGHWRPLNSQLGPGFIAIVFINASLSSTLRIEEFYAKSFVPDDIEISYNIFNFEEINFNLTIRVPFPGKLLMHIFVRKLADEVGGSQQEDIMRLKNKDLCKLLDGLRNITIEEIPGESLLPSTFIISCPLNSGFYYVENAAIETKLIPVRIPDGRYLVLFELIQVYEEVIKLLTCRIKLFVKMVPEPSDSSMLSSSEENTKTTKTPEFENETKNVEVSTEPAEDDYDASNDYQ